MSSSSSSSASDSSTPQPQPQPTKRCRTFRNAIRKQKNNLSSLPPATTTDPQLSCPLFTVLPPELRLLIYKYALRAYDDKSFPFKKSAYYYRPGFQYASRIDTDLLLTCRRVYAEAAELPVRLNPLDCWYFRSPPWRNAHWAKLDAGRTTDYSHVKHWHLFTQLYWLEADVGGFRKFASCATLEEPWRRPSRRPAVGGLESLTITIRHSDWWWWERKVRLQLDPERGFDDGTCRWGQTVRRLKGLRRFVMELETVEEKMDELDRIVEGARGWDFGDLVLDKTRTRREGWVGAVLDRREVDHSFNTTNTTGNYWDVGFGLFDDIGVERPLPKTRFRTPCTARERLIARGVVFDDENSLLDLPEEDRMTYYVVKLTWVRNS
ncbi:MAG: hypothetical protein Q9167_001330 [Letrouitia subvulpina]